MTMPSPASTLGALLIGCVVSSMFYGITSLQTYFYFTNYARDRVGYRISVAILWLLDSLHTALIVYTTYHYVVFINPEVLYVPDWTTSSLIIVTNISDLIIRLVFLYRIYHLTNQSYLKIAPICLVVLCTAVLGILYGIWVRTLSFSTLHLISWALYCTLSGGVAADLAITAFLSILLARMRSGVKRTDSFLTILILYTINTGLLTCLIAIATLATYTTMSANYIFIGIFAVLGKASFNSLLATLNARSHLHNDVETANNPVPPTIASFAAMHSVSWGDERASVEVMVGKAL